MPAPCRKRRIQQPPQFRNFKPCGIPAKFLQSVILSVDEFEALRLADYSNLDHARSAQQMDISRPTFSRLIEKARHKVARAIIDGQELVIEGGPVVFKNTLHLCRNCGRVHKTKIDKKVHNCLNCGSDNLENLARTNTERS